MPESVPAATSWVNEICSKIDWDGLATTVSNVTWDRLKNEILAVRDGQGSETPAILIRLSELEQRLRLKSPGT